FLLLPGSPARCSLFRPEAARHGTSALLHQAESEVRCAGCLHQARALQFDVLRVGRVEQLRSRPEQDVREVEPELVYQPGVHELPNDIRPAHDCHVLVCRRGPRARQSVLYAVGDEEVSRAPVITMGSPGLCVTTNTGIPNGGGSPHGSTPTSNIS